MKKLLFATGNPAKVKRFASKLYDNDIKLMSLDDINENIDVEENGKDAIENALIKAWAYYNAVHMDTMAMDDNLYIEGIKEDLQPGMFVRRVNGKRLSDEEMIDYYSSLAKQYGTNGKLTARWVYGLAIIKDGQAKTYTWSKEDFYIVDKPSKIINPGYPLNSISVNKKFNKYFTEMTQEDLSTITNTDDGVISFICNNI